MVTWLRLVLARAWRIWMVGIAIGLLSGLVSGWVPPGATAAAHLSVILFWVLVTLAGIAQFALVYIDCQGRARRLYRDRNEAYGLTLLVALLGGAGAIALFEAMNSQVAALVSGADAGAVGESLAGRIGMPGALAALAALVATGFFAARWARRAP